MSELIPLDRRDRQCAFIRPDGLCCGSYAFNLGKEGISDQGFLCDRHYWQQRALVGLDPALERALETWRDEIRGPGHIAGSWPDQLCATRVRKALADGIAKDVAG